MDGIEKILIRGRFRIGLVIQKNGRIVWINGDNGAQTVMGGDLGQHDGRPSLVTANLNNRATSRHARSEQPQKASFVLPKMTRDLPSFLPRIVKDSLEICRNGDGSQRSSP